MNLMNTLLFFTICSFFGCGTSASLEEAVPIENEQETVIENDTTDQEITWKDLPVPADAGANMVWQFQDISDNFEYEAEAENKGDLFLSKWDDFYHNNWAGPGLTEWKREHSLVADGHLQIWAARKPASNKINMGCITSKTRVLYPVYIEARAKIMNSTLASDVWLLSPDDTQEIDIVEPMAPTIRKVPKKTIPTFLKKYISATMFLYVTHFKITNQEMPGLGILTEMYGTKTFIPMAFTGKTLGIWNTILTVNW